MKLKKILLMMLALFLIVSSPILFANNTIYTEDKPNITVTKTSPEFTIKLKSNPTTGYSWVLRAYNANLILPVKHFFQRPSNQKLMGAGGYELWTFRVKPAGFVAPQQTTIRMIYARPWEGVGNATQVIFWVKMQ